MALNLQKINDRLQLIASVGVLIGLALVAYELRQDRHLARATLGADAVSGYVDVYKTALDESTARALAKSAENPEEMTLEDHIVVESFFRLVITELVTRENYLQQQGVFPSFEVGYPHGFSANVIFSTEYGRAWWEANRSNISDLEAEPIERAYEMLDTPLFTDRVKLLEDRLANQAENP